MKTFRNRTGFTLIELMVVVGILGIVVAMAIPSLKAYRLKEVTRGTAKDVSGWVTDARSRAIAGGRMTFLLFEPPNNGLFPFDPGQFASLVTDANGNGTIDDTDTASPIYLRGDANGHVRLYDSAASTLFADVNISPDDLSARSPDIQLGQLAGGTTLPISAAIGVPAVAFSPQGAPVAMDTPDQWGTGAGGIYLTDDQNLVLAVLVMPLGEVKVQSFDTGTGEWK